MVLPVIAACLIVTHVTGKQLQELWYKLELSRAS